MISEPDCRNGVTVLPSCPLQETGSPSSVRNRPDALNPSRRNGAATWSAAQRAGVQGSRPHVTSSFHVRGIFYPQTVNRTESTEIAVYSIFGCGFGYVFFVVFGVRPRFWFYTETEPNNRINRNSLRHPFIPG